MTKKKTIHILLFSRFPDLDKSNTSHDQQKLLDAAEHVMESYVDAFIVSIKADTKKWDWYFLRIILLAYKFYICKTFKAIPEQIGGNITEEKNE